MTQRPPPPGGRAPIDRCVRIYWRSDSYNLVRSVLVVIMALLFGTVYWRMGVRRISPSDRGRILEVGFLFLPFPPLPSWQIGGGDCNPTRSQQGGGGLDPTQTLFA